MRAIGYVQSLPIDNEQAIYEMNIPVPEMQPHDLLVRIKAVSVNPLDALERMRRPNAPGNSPVLGWDAAGIVESVGTAVTKFKPGDEVYYSGALNRQGSNAEIGVVDERVTALKPKTLPFTEAAAIPLTAITAWECLFDRLKVAIGKKPCDDSLMVIGAAGGVGSMAVQLARRLTNLNIIGTASRPESEQWVRKLGAHHVINHTRPLSVELQAHGLPLPRYILSMTNTDDHWDEIVASLAPQGEICLIDNAVGIDVMKLKRKAGALHTEMMFVKVLNQLPDMVQIHRLLTEVAAMIDEGLIKTTMGENYGPLSVENLRRAHAAIETRRTIGKIVLTGFDGA